MAFASERVVRKWVRSNHNLLLAGKRNLLVVLAITSKTLVVKLGGMRCGLANQVVHLPFAGFQTVFPILGPSFKLLGRLSLYHGSRSKDMNKTTTHDSSPADQSWLEKNVNIVIIALVIACALSLLAHLWPGLHYTEDHKAHFDEEKVFGFQALFGFVVFVVIVFLGSGLRLIVERKEDYYDRD